MKESKGEVDALYCSNKGMRPVIESILYDQQQLALDIAVAKEMQAAARNVLPLLADQSRNRRGGH